MRLCYRFLETLHIKNVYLDRDYHRCFCEPCFTARGDQAVYTRGKPPMDYALPVGWAKFALRAGSRASAMNVWEEWHVAFHGTKGEVVEKILRAGDLLMPEDKTPDGLKLAPPPGHFTESRKPDGFEIRQIFLSPSIRYSGLTVYAPQTSFEDPDSKQTKYGRVALQVRIKSDSYKVGRETVGATERGITIDPNFSNARLEWSTDCRGVIILVGIVIKVEDDQE